MTLATTTPKSARTATAPIGVRIGSSAISGFIGSEPNARRQEGHQSD